MFLLDFKRCIPKSNTNAVNGHLVNAAHQPIYVPMIRLIKYIKYANGEYRYTN